MELNSIAAALTMGIAAIATAWAEVAIGSAAMGAIAEREELFGKGLILTVIPETIVILGFVIAMMILSGGH